MNIIEILNEIKDNEEAKNIFAAIIVSLIKNDNNLKESFTDFLINEVSFGIVCEDVYDYSYTGKRISLSISGYTIAGDSFSISNN